MSVQYGVELWVTLFLPGSSQTLNTPGVSNKPAAKRRDSHSAPLLLQLRQYHTMILLPYEIITPPPHRNKNKNKNKTNKQKKTGLTEPVPHASCLPHPPPPTPPESNMPAWYPLELDSRQLSLKLPNSATELPSDSVAQLVRTWQAICQVAGSNISLSHCLFFLLFLSFSPFFLTDFDLG